MRTYTRNASVHWLGTHEHGKGAITTPSAILNKIPYCFGNNGNRRMTSPPELMAAAHAGSFSMSLAHELGIAGFTPKKIDTTATVTMEPLGLRWRMTQIHLDIVATVGRMVQCDFIDAALRAKANCPISQLVSANISMRAKLSPGAAAERLLPHRPLVPTKVTLQKTKTQKNRAGH